MSNFTLHNQDTAPEAAQPLLENSVKAFGMIPNLHAVMAEAPVVLEGYQTLHSLAQQSSFSKEELTVVWQTINVEHACHYCVPAHTAIAKGMKVDDDIVAALRAGQDPADEKLAVLRQTTLTMVRERGQLSATQVEQFYAAGFTKQNMLEIVLVLAQKVMSNYVNHLADTPVDAPFQAFAWEPVKG